MTFDMGFPESPDLANKKMLLYLSVVETHAVCGLHATSKEVLVLMHSVVLS